MSPVFCVMAADSTATVGRSRSCNALLGVPCMGAVSQIENLYNTAKKEAAPQRKAGKRRKAISNHFYCILSATNCQA